MKIVLHDPIPVHVAPVNAATQKWGVCAVPWMWRYPDGRLMICVGGHQDTHAPDYEQQVPDAYYVSADEGKTWEILKNGPVFLPEFTGSEPPFVRLKNGTWINFRLNRDRQRMNGLPHIKEVPCASLEQMFYIYRFGEIPESCIAAELAVYDAEGNLERIENSRIEFPDYELGLIAASKYTDGEEMLIDAYTPAEELLAPQWQSIQGIVELPDGTLAGTMYGQCPHIQDREYGIVYLAVSSDGGRSWSKRSEIGPYDPALAYGYGYENSLAMAPNGDLIAAMRTEHCVPHNLEPQTGVMFCRSKDFGYTWSKPAAITDSSVTPHLVVLENGVTVLVYGRPGVHVRFSVDSGENWSEPITVIGQTLEAHLAVGDDYMDCKYWKMDTYANTFLYGVSKDSVLLVYNDMKYQTGDGLDHRATLVQRITFFRE